MVLGGLGLGLVAVATTGAARARTAYDRLNAETLGPDGFADASGLDDAGFDQLHSLPGVEGFARFAFVPIAPAPLAPGGEGIAFAAVDADFLTKVVRPHVIAGRLADPDAADEIVVNETLADAADLGPGDRVTLQAGFEDPQEVGDATVVGIVRTTLDVGPSAGGAVLLLSQTAFEALPAPVREQTAPNAVVRLSDGPDGLDDFTAAASEALGQPVQVQSAADGQRVIEDSLGVQATGYALLAAVAALATALAVGQGLARLLGQAFSDLPTLRSLGLRPRDRVMTGVLLIVPVAVASSMLALALGWLASDRVPTGFARSVDPLSGRQLAPGLTAVLVAAWLVVLVGAAAALAWREDLRRAAPARARRPLIPRPRDLRSRLGVDAALRSPGQPGGAAARSALVTAAVGVAGVVAVVVFGASLSHLFATPRLQGWSFDAVVQDFEAMPASQFREATASLSDDPAVAAVAYADLTGVTIEGRLLETVVLAEGANHLQPTIRTGRPATADDEVVLGTQALAGAGVGLGDTVTAEGPAGTAELTVVGTATYPMLGNDTETTRLATITRDAGEILGAEPVNNQLFVDLRPGNDADELSEVAEAVGGEALAPFENVSVKNTREVRGFPWVVGAFFALVAGATIAHGLLRSVAVRRREFAELSALGLTRLDRRRVVAAQGLTLAAIAGVVGVVLGIVAGRLAWTQLASGLGVVDEPVVPAARIALIVAATTVVCVLIAMAAPPLVRLHTSRDLRAE